MIRLDRVEPAGILLDRVVPAGSLLDLVDLVDMDNQLAVEADTAAVVVADMAVVVDTVAEAGAGIDAAAADTVFVALQNGAEALALHAVGNPRKENPSIKIVSIFSFLRRFLKRL